MSQVITKNKDDLGGKKSSYGFGSKAIDRLTTIRLTRGIGYHNAVMEVSSERAKGPVIESDIKKAEEHVDENWEMDQKHFQELLKFNKKYMSEPNAKAMSRIQASWKKKK